MGRRYIEAINNDDFDLLAEIVAVDFKDQAQVEGMASGLDWAPSRRTSCCATPSPMCTSPWTTLSSRAIGWVIRAAGTGTHKGDFFGIPATGNAVK